MGILLRKYKYIRHMKTYVKQNGIVLLTELGLKLLN